MSKTIDERVVEMRFDNKQFEANAKESLSTIDKLKQALSFSSSTNGIDRLEKSVSEVNLGPLGDAADTVRVKFSALEIAAITALQNIVNRAVDAGIQLVKSLSVDQISSGFEEYGLKMGSIQTIMASTGESLDTVNKYLEDLNTYSDKTIYSFSDMTQSIGKFTNAGVSLDSAVKAIQGVSNVAAVSGANANEASRAMYNFAQALSAGAVKLIDWKSIENANMATVEFKQSLLDTAVIMGTVVKEGDQYRTTTTDLNGKVSDLFTSTTAFNDSLSHQWLTTDVLIQTLSNYSTDVREMTDAEKQAYEEKLRTIGYTEEQIQGIEELGKKAFDSAQDVKTFSQLMDTLKESVGSGWAQTFELIVGNFEEAKALWTDVNNAIGTVLQQQSDARNDLIRGWKEGGGREALIEAISNSWKAILAIIKPIKAALSEIFPPATSKQLYELTERLRDFTSKLIISDETARKLKTAFTGLFAGIDIIKQGFEAAVVALSPFLEIISDLANAVLDSSVSFGEWMTNLDKSIRENRTFLNVAEQIRSKIADMYHQFKQSGYEITIFGVSLSTIIDKIKDLIVVAKEWAKTNITVPDFETVEAFIGSAISTIEEKFNYFIDILTEFGKTHIQVPDAQSIKDFVKNVGNEIQHLIEILLNWGKMEFTSPGTGFIEGFTSAIKERVWTLEDVRAFAQKVTDKIVKLFSDALSAITEFGKTSLGKISEIFSNALSVITAVGKGVGEVLADVGAKVKQAFNDFTGGGYKTLLEIIDNGVLAAIGLSFRNLINDFSSVFSEVSDLIKSVSSGFEEVNGVIKGLKEIEESIVGTFEAIQTRLKAKVLLTIAIAIGILTASMVALSTAIDAENLESTLGALTGIFVDLFGATFFFSKGMSGTGAIGIGKAAVSMIAFSASISILASALKKIAEIDSEKLEASLGVLSGLVIEMAGVTALISKSGGGGIGEAASMVAFATSVAIVGGALFIFQKAIDKFGHMDAKAAIDGLKTIGLLFTELALFDLGAGKAEHVFSSSASVWVIAEGLSALYDTLSKLKNNTPGEVAAGLLVLGAALGELAIGLNFMSGTLSGSAAMVVAAAALALLVPVISLMGVIPWLVIATGLGELAAVFAVFGVAAKLLQGVAPGMVQLAGAMALLGVAVAAVSLALVAITPIATAAAAALVVLIGALVVGIADAIINNADKIKEAVITVIVLVCDVIKAYKTTLVEVMLTIIETILKSLEDHLPTIVPMLLDIIDKLIVMLDEKIPDIVHHAASLLSNLFAALREELGKIDDQFLLDAIEGIGFIGAFMLAMNGLAALGPGAIEGVLSAGKVIGELAILLAAMGALSSIPGFDWLIGEGSAVLGQIGSAIGNFIGSIIGDLVASITAKMPQIATDLSNFMTNLQPLLEGAKTVDDAALEGVKKLGAIILVLTAADIINGLTGGSALKKFGDELKTFSGTDVNQLSNVINQVEKLADIAKDISAGKLSGLKDLGSGLKQMGTDAINNFVQTFTGSSATVTSAINSLIGYAESAFNLGKYDLHDAAKAVGEDASSALKTGIENRKSLVTTSVETLDKSIIDTMRNKLPSESIKTIGSNTMQYLINGLNSKQTGLTNSVEALGRETINTMRTSLPGTSITPIGTKVVTDFTSGITSKASSVTTAVKSLCSSIITQISNSLPYNSLYTRGQNVITYLANGMTASINNVSNAAANAGYYATVSAQNNMSYNAFYTIGWNAGQGLENGISAKINSIAQASANAAQTAIRSARSTLGIRSPSRVFLAIGNNLSSAMSSGMLQNLSEISSAGEEMAGTVIDPVQTAIEKISSSMEEGDSGFQPTITPVIDLTNVNSAAGQISTMFRGFNLGTSIQLAQATASDLRRNSSSSSDNEDRERDRRMEEKMDRFLATMVEAYQGEIHNVFYVQSTDPKQAAEEIGYIMQHKVERGRAAWAR